MPALVLTPATATEPTPVPAPEGTQPSLWQMFLASQQLADDVRRGAPLHREAIADLGLDPEHVVHS